MQARLRRGVFITGVTGACPHSNRFYAPGRVSRRSTFAVFCGIAFRFCRLRRPRAPVLNPWELDSAGLSQPLLCSESRCMGTNALRPFGTRENLPGFAHQKLPTKSPQIDGVCRPEDRTPVQHGHHATMRLREAKALHAFSVDEIESSILAHGQGPFFVWVTLHEHKWVTSRERRSCGLSEAFQRHCRNATRRTLRCRKRRQSRCGGVSRESLQKAEGGGFQPTGAATPFFFSTDSILKGRACNGPV